MEKPNRPSAIVVPAGEGQGKLRVFDDIMTFSLRGKQTDGAFTLIHDQVLPGGEVSMHIQHKGQETFLFIDGGIEFRIGEADGKVKTIPTTPGMVIHIPPGVAHSYKNNTKTISTFFVLFAPAGQTESFFEQIGVPVSDLENLPPFTPPDPQHLMTLLQQYSVINVAPPNGDQARREGEHP